MYTAVSTSDEILRQAQVFEPDIVDNLDESDRNSLDTIRKLRSTFPGVTKSYLPDSFIEQDEHGQV